LRQQRLLAQAVLLCLPEAQSAQTIIESVSFSPQGKIGVRYIQAGVPAQSDLIPHLLLSSTLSEGAANGSPARPEIPYLKEIQGKRLTEAIRALRGSGSFNLIGDYYQRYDYPLPDLVEQYYGYLTEFGSLSGSDPKISNASLQDLARQYLCDAGEPVHGVFTLRSRSWFLDEQLEIPAGLMDVLLDPAALHDAYVALDVRAQAAAALDDQRLAVLAIILKEELGEENDLEEHAPFYRFYASLTQPQRAALLFSEGLLLEDVNRSQLALLEQALASVRRPENESAPPLEMEALAGIALAINESGETPAGEKEAAAPRRIAYQLRSLSFLMELHDRVLLEGIVTSPGQAKAKMQSQPAASTEESVSETGDQ